MECESIVATNMQHSEPRMDYGIIVMSGFGMEREYISVLVRGGRSPPHYARNIVSSIKWTHFAGHVLQA